MTDPASPWNNKLRNAEVGRAPWLLPLHADVRHPFCGCLVDPLHHSLELLARSKLIKIYATILDGSVHALLPQHGTDELVPQHSDDFLYRRFRADGLCGAIHVPH